MAVAILFLFQGCSNEEKNDNHPESPKKEVRQYKSIKMGDQIWMAKNLNTDRFRNGDLIPEVKNMDDWRQACKMGEPAWCYYENNPVNGMKYGKLYNWYAVNDARGLAPEEWHIPDVAEFNTLEKTVKDNGFILKEIGQEVFTTDGNGTTNTAFGALLAGVRIDYGSFDANFSGGSFKLMGVYCLFWTKTEAKNGSAIAIQLKYYSSGIESIEYKKYCGFYVRCVKDTKAK